MNYTEARRAQKALYGNLRDGVPVKVNPDILEPLNLHQSRKVVKVVRQLTQRGLTKSLPELEAALQAKTEHYRARLDQAAKEVIRRPLRSSDIPWVVNVLIKDGPPLYRGMLIYKVLKFIHNNRPQGYKNIEDNLLTYL